MYGLRRRGGGLLFSDNMRERWLLREQYLCLQRQRMPQLDRHLRQRKLRGLRRARAGVLRPEQRVHRKSSRVQRR